MHYYSMHYQIYCLDRKYLDVDHNINKAIFDISRYGKYQHSINFDSPVTEKIAIKAVEKYLSKPLTEEYYNTIKDDMFHSMLLYDEAKENYKCRGKCLTDCKFLEDTQIENGILTFFIGS